MTQIDTILNSFVKIFKNQLDCLAVNEKASTENYDRAIHWEKIGLSCEAVSKECTILSVVFSKPPPPSEQDLSSLLHQLGLSVDVLLAWYKTFPLSEGKFLHSYLKPCIVDVVECACGFLNTLATDKTKEGAQRLLAIGKVWSNCDLFKTLPKDNCSALICNVDKTYNFLSDAMIELKESFEKHKQVQLNGDTQLEDTELEGSELEESDDDNKETWSADEVLLINPAISILMACKGLLKKAKDSFQELSYPLNKCKEVDVFYDHVITLSPTVDDFVMALYPPVDKLILDKEMRKLETKITNILQTLRSIFDLPSIVERLKFIEKAFDHNLIKLKNHISESDGK